MTSEVEGAVERLTEVMNDAIADHEDDVARAWEDGERPDLWDAPDVTVSIPDLRRVLAALRAQAERVRVLETAVLDAALSDRLDEAGSPLSWREIAEAAERRAGELEGALRWYGEQAANCRKITSDGDTARRALDRDGGAKARSLLPATQAGGEK